MKNKLPIILLFLPMLLLAQMTIVNPYLNASAPSGFANMVINPNNLLANPNNMQTGRFPGQLTMTYDVADGNAINDSDRGIPTNTNSGKQLSGFSSNLATGTTYEFAAFVKADGYANLMLVLGNAAFDFFPYASFNLLTGVVNGHNGVSAAIEPMGNDWYRCSFRLTTVASGPSALQLRLGNIATANSSSATFTGDGVSGMLFWGLEFFIVP